MEGAKTNGPAAARDVLGRLDLHGKVITADALHTVKATAGLIYQRGGQFVLPVKENRQALFISGSARFSNCRVAPCAWDP